MQYQSRAPILRCRTKFQERKRLYSVIPKGESTDDLGISQSNFQYEVVFSLEVDREGG